MKVSSPLSGSARVAIVKAYLAAKLVNSPAAWLKVIALVPNGLSLVSVSMGVPFFMKPEVEPVPAGWEEGFAAGLSGAAF